ncbi:amidase family protein [Pseudomonas helleri]|uniref:amidase family protein n=1 Tax=Pseudomonas helleri TaxID=1608996 RepID=UPI003FD52F73
MYCLDYTPRHPASVVKRLPDTGAALEGKINLDQFTCSLNGTRSPHGLLPNSLNPRYVAGASSTGSAYAITTGHFAVDTAGSRRLENGTSTPAYGSTVQGFACDGLNATHRS